MSKIEITKTELVWPGKYNEDGTLREVPRVSLPFQVIETVNESRATREAQKVTSLGLFDVYEGKEGDTFESGWRNKLIWGDNLLVMGSLAQKFAGKVDLIYIDPPFATGTDFSFTAPIGDSGLEIHKEQSLIEEKAYRDTWGAGTESYLAMMRDRIAVMFDLLSDKGSLLVHCDWHVSYLLRCILDQQFGSERFLNEIVWYYYNKFQGNVNRFASNHDVILWYSKSSEYKFRTLKEKRAEGTVKQIKRKWDKDAGRIVNVKGSDGKVLYQETDEKTVDDVWRISMLQPADKTQNVGYPTQKPELVLERIIEAISDPGDLVADFFCGSGTTLAVAERLNRRWIGCDLGRWATHVARKRLLGIEHCKPFEVLNLGKYERQYWQGVTFGETKDKKLTERAIYEYLAFILKLYRSEPVAGLSQIHGKKGKAMVHIGAVDAPVTIGEIDAAVNECAKLKQSELHVLGWEWEMGLI
jgi:adenine-specific DNA-methyltransferase